MVNCTLSREKKGELKLELRIDEPRVSVGRRISVYLNLTKSELAQEQMRNRNDTDSAKFNCSSDQPNEPPWMI